MKRSKKRNYAIIVLIVLLIAIAVGYAAFSSELTINGSADTTADWEVVFSSAALLDSNNDAAASSYGTAAVDSNDATQINATVHLAYPGDAVKLRAVITNSGNLDAKITSINVDTSDLDSDIIITPTALGSAGLPTANEVLAVGASCTCEFVIQWVPESTAASADGDFTITFTYSQNDGEITITPAHTHSNS